MTAQLGYKRRVRLYDSAPERIRAARASPLLLPVGAYWAACGLLCYAVVSGSLPIGRLLDGELTGEHKTAPRSRARRVRAKPAPPPLPTEPPPAVREPVAEPANVVEPPPTEPPAVPSFQVELPAPPANVHRPIERSAPDVMPRQREPVAALSKQRSAPEREPIPISKPEIAEPAQPTPGPTFGSCEAALESYSEQMDFAKGARVSPDVPLARYAAILERGDYFSHCAVPDDMAIEICAAVQNGRAVGITIVTRPASARVRNCVASAVRSLRFPVHPRLDVTRTRFDALR